MENESIFETSSSELDSIPDQALDLEADTIAEQGREESSVPDSEAEQGSVESSFVDSFDDFGSPVSVRGDDSYLSAVTSLDSFSVSNDDSSFYAAVIQGQQDIHDELQRVEGYSISILYSLYIIIALLIGGWFVKWITHFTNFD